MRSSSGQYFSRLDHVRAIAAFVVYCWHFIHPLVPYAYVPSFFALSIFEEGHIGVSLFMTLSGYLFAKITAGDHVDLRRFYLNRFLRLAPLLALMLAYWMLRGRFAPSELLSGFVFPAWPAGMWSITAEMHFYLVFPLILMLQRRARILPLVALLVLAVAMRTGVWMYRGEVQDLAYWTIGGCIDLFVAGMLWHELAERGIGRVHAGALLGVGLLAALTLAHVFNRAGGFYDLGGYPSPSSAWIVLPTLNGLIFGAMIVGYENWQVRLPGWLDVALAKAGEVSYSVYLIQFAIYPIVSKALVAIGVPMQIFGVALASAVLSFPLMVAVGWVSYVFIERPFLALRRRYDGPRKGSAAPRPAAICA